MLFFAINRLPRCLWSSIFLDLISMCRGVKWSSERKKLRQQIWEWTTIHSHFTTLILDSYGYAFAKVKTSLVATQTGAYWIVAVRPAGDQGQTGAPKL